MSEWSKEGNLIDSTEPSAQVVEEPRLNVPPSLSTAAVLPVTAQSLAPGPDASPSATPSTGHARQDRRPW